MSSSHRSFSAKVLLLLALPTGLSACTSDRVSLVAEGIADDGGGGGGGGTGGDSGLPAPKGLSLLWRVVESGPIGVFIDAGSGPVDPTRVSDLPGIAGVKICIHGRPQIPCATSGADGTFTLKGLPARQNIILVSEKKDYVRSIRPIETASTDMDNSNAPLVTARADGARPDLGFEFDDTLGVVSFFALGVEPDGGLGLPTGVTVSLTPSTAKGPYFTTKQNTFVEGGEATAGGIGFFFNVVPGDYELTFHNDHGDCAALSFPFGAWGFPGPPPTVKFPVLSGYVTDQVGVLCTQKSVIVAPDASAPTGDAG